MEGILKFLLLFYFLTVFYKSTTYCYEDLSSPIITLPEGKIRGLYKKNFYNETTLAFYSVPYGTPPVGELRFKAPEPVKPWNGILNASMEIGPCYTKELFFGTNLEEIYGEEGCLVLNVYTKQSYFRENEKDFKKNLKPVMVFLYGSGFIEDTINDRIFVPSFLLVEDIVVVLINYRLGLSGFLSLEDPSLGVPGNAGLKDQVLGLKWVQRNIERFGGDPRRVTLCGETAGAASVHYHILSPASRGLFQRAITVSGSALCPWALGKPNARIVARALGIPEASEREVLDILRTMTGNETFLLQDEIFDPLIYSTLRPFVPVVEKPNPDAFITKPPIDIIRSGEYNRVPVLFGYASNEGILLDWIKIIEPEVAEKYNYELAIPWYMYADEQQRRTIVEIMKKTYSPFDNPRVKELLKMDTSILAPVAATAVNHFRAARNVPLYAFRIDVETKRNFFKVQKHLEKVPGTADADSIGFLWDAQELPRPNPGTIEALTVYRFVKLWTNFAIYGNPTPNKDLGVIWPPIDNDQAFKVLEIGEKLQILGNLPEHDRLQVWREIYKQSQYTANYL